MVKVGIKFEGPGVDGIHLRAYTRSGIASTLQKANERHGTVVCDTIFKAYPETAELRKELELELLLQGARNLEVQIYDDDLTGGAFVDRDTYIALLLKRHEQNAAEPLQIFTGTI